ncbi:hypothetical protein [Oleispirillum naphthae]|uniref:hypothetical protein n=1 Tax=Oleispirillum naphthae TaxID=2838853 RepID=UPI0030823B0F
MTPEEFRALLDTYGADLTRWPHARRQAAQKLLQDSEPARTQFAEAQELDILLSAAEPALTEARRKSLTDAILDNLPDDPLPRQARELPRAPARPASTDRAVGIGVLVRPLAGLWVACLACGILLGVGLYVGQQRLTATAESDWTGTLTVFGVN